MGLGNQVHGNQVMSGGKTHAYRLDGPRFELGASWKQSNSVNHSTTAPVIHWNHDFQNIKF
jgi:hypothetical protein